MRTTKVIQTVISLLVFLTLIACSNDDDNNTLSPAEDLNIVETAQATPSLSILVDAIIKADLATTLSSDGPFTVFAPTNAAFEDLLDGLDGYSSLDDFDTSAEIDLLATILTYHVIYGEIMAADLTDGAMPETVQGQTIEVDLDGGAKLIDATGTPANITTTDIETTNGVVHLIDKVLLPEGVWDELNPTIADFVAGNPDYSSLLAALEAADLTGALDSDDINYTIFAPNNDAFDTFLSDNGFATLADVPVDVLTQVLLNHVIGTEAFSGDLTTTYVSTLATEPTSENNLSMYINTDGGVTINGVSTVTTADINVRNGVIHAVDEVIGLPTIVTFATADPTFETLVAALTREDSFTYVETLSSTDGDPDPFTVFAPTNAAFADLLTELSVASLNDIDATTLEATLNHHVVADANVLSTMLSDDMTIPTIGGDITANITGGATLTDANDRVSNIIVVDVQAWNGVIHAIDKVVLPEL